MVGQAGINHSAQGQQGFTVLMWEQIAATYMRMVTDVDLIERRVDAKSTDGTVSWSLYRIGKGVIRLDIKAAKGTFASEERLAGADAK